MKASSKKTVSALVTKAIDLPTGPSVPTDTTIIVDLDNMVGYYQNAHFDVFPDEIALLN